MTLDELKALNNKQRKPMSHKESTLQRQCVTWFRLVYPEVVIFAVPNAAKRGKALAAIMKAEGMLAGVADLFVMAARNGHNGLFIEMKTKDGKQTDTQKEFERKANEAGYRYDVCRSFEEFKQIISKYLEA